MKPESFPERQKVTAGRPWAAVVGYSRAVREGDRVEVSGTSATTPDGQVVAPGDAYLQTQYILAEIVAALAELGATPADVLRTRVYLTDIDQWEAAGRAHGEVFAGLDPACTFIEVGRLMLDGLVVEVELSAVVGPERR
jgi:enamine deaminase RidA (YjgF/YER057c/UK114 family)